MWFEEDFFLKILFIFEDRGREGETLVCERYIDRLPLSHPQMGTWPTTQPCALTGNRTGDLLVPRWVLNPLSHTSKGVEDYFLRPLSLPYWKEKKNPHQRDRYKWFKKSSNQVGGGDKKTKTKNQQSSEPLFSKPETTSLNCFCVVVTSISLINLLIWLFLDLSAWTLLISW